MKKTFSVALFIVMAIIMMSMQTMASTYAGTFTDFENYATFEPGSDAVNVSDAEIKDYYLGGLDGGILTDNPTIRIVDGKGFNGSKALAITKPSVKENSEFHLYATPANGIATTYAGAKYLRVWVDFTGVDFRKANYGIIASDNGLYRTDEEDSREYELPFYLQNADGTWSTLNHGTDGCFGVAQDSSVAGFKGWMAVPLDNFPGWGQTNAAIDDTYWDYSKAIKAVYFYFDFNDEVMLGTEFYMDEFQLVADYTKFDEIAVVEETPVVVEETPAVTDENPDTSDNSVIFFVLAIASIFVIAINRIGLKVKA
ncbi:MAG: hypothetical protein K0S55_1898 [Clostridia bacterium]|nr:hypothetical protein [Clostridia bacterium]